MSLERRVSQMRQKGGAESSPYSLILNALDKDSRDVWALYIQRNSNRSGISFTDPLSTDLEEVYELRPTNLPTFSLPSNFSFTEGFSLVRRWYALVRPVATGQVALEDEQIMDSELGRMFPDRVVTTRNLRKALTVDPSGADWLNDMASAEFTEGTLALIGARKAITGVKNMYEALTSAT